MQDKNKLFTELIAPLHLQMQLSQMAYKKYLHNKIFAHAASLYKVNKRIVRLILNNSVLLPEDLKGELVRLVNHYDIWFVQFKLHKKKIKPEADDEFVFQQADDQCAFPAEAEKKLNDYFIKLYSESLVGTW